MKRISILLSVLILAAMLTACKGPANDTDIGSNETEKMMEFLLES